MRVTILAGGTGGAKLACGFADAIRSPDLTVVTNVGDDDEFWGLLVCPDTDAVLYRLAGLFNEEAGFGVRGDSFNAIEMLTLLQEPTWFGLGDGDLGVQLLRNSLMSRGARLTAAVAEIARRLRIAVAVLPVTDDKLRTRIITPAGELAMQSWFVQMVCEPAVVGLRFEGLEKATPSTEVVAAVAAADAIVIGPSNPLISIDPIAKVLRPWLAGRHVIAISPVVAGQSLKGPTVDMLRQLGEEPTARGVAKHYAGIATHFVLDILDADLAPDIAALGMGCTLLNTRMDGRHGEARLARDIIAIVARLRHSF